MTATADLNPRSAPWLDLLGFAGEEAWVIATFWTAAGRLLEASDHAGASAVFEGLERLLPDHPIGLIGQAEVARETERFGDMQRFGQRAAECTGADRAHLAHALQLAATGAEGRRRFSEARTLLERALRVAPENSRIAVQQQLARLDQRENATPPRSTDR
ncbi:MAG: hypothetical protein AAF797_18075 [Planctomycetota bacterium]